MTASQIRSNRQELSSEATSENKLEPVDYLKLSLQFQEQSTEVDQVQMTSQSSSNKQELSSEATSENKLELVTNLKAFQFQGKSTEVDQAPTASQISSTTQEPSSEATSHPTDNKTLLQDQETFNPEGTENKMVHHTCYVNNQLELDSEITGTNNPFSFQERK